MVDASGIPRRPTPQSQAQKHNDLARQVEQQGSARRLESASIGKGGLTIRDGGKLVVDGDAQINGTLSLPKGIIDNDALATPLEMVTINSQSAGAPAVGPDGVLMVESIVQVPAGFTRAAVTVTAMGRTYNQSGQGDYMYVTADVYGYASPEALQWVENGRASSATASKTAALTGLAPGSEIGVSSFIRSGSRVFAASTLNFASLSATIFFLR